MQNIFFNDSNSIENIKFNYSQNKPYNHFVIDNFINHRFLDKVLSEIESKDFLNSSSGGYFTNNESRKNKFASLGQINGLENFNTLLNYFNSKDFVNFLENITNIKSIIVDHTFSGAGLHVSGKESFLKLHADYNYHQNLKVYRRLNAILFLNKEWKEEYGGYLELWNKDLTKSETKIKPEYNKLVVFEVNDNNYHGFPDPLIIPDKVKRYSIATFYYTVERGSRSFLPRGTKYVTRKGEKYKKKSRYNNLYKKLVPPIFFDIFEFLKKFNR
jgi:Rps23 Pro-64 3,4-dihydroxylase Tpa1-like proline 4-hydroxylase